MREMGYRGREPGEKREYKSVYSVKQISQGEGSGIMRKELGIEGSGSES